MRQCAHCKVELRRNAYENDRKFMARRHCSAKCGHNGYAEKCAKLNPDRVREIRDQIERGESNATIAVRYGVSAPTIWSIKMGRSWREVV